jgi:two-component system CheB/CheR fusion protein
MDSSEPSGSGAPVEISDALQGGRSKDGPFVVVGVGASAGGLEALSDLLANLPENTGMAFVVVQHLDPQHETMLSTLLSRVTHLPVLEATQDLAVCPDHVYVIPKNTTMTIVRGVLQLEPRGGTSRPHLPIDLFLKSLARDRQVAAIGVILSGTGSDGTLGIEELKAAGGITFAQDDASAKYPGMPQSAVRSGCIDRVLPPDQIARELARISQNPYVAPDQAAAAGGESGAGDDVHFKTILGILRAAFRVDFSAYRETTVRRRILRRMVLHTKDNLAEYIQHLQRDRAETEALYQDILINVTSFFRETEAFDVLQESVFPEILETKNPDTPIRIWVPGWSTGQEAYSLAMALVEFLERQVVRPPIQIFATDLSETVSLVKAREGVYPDNIAAEVSPERLRRFFTREQETYRVINSIRDMCVFAKQNVAADPPFSRLDLISCRNVLIYLTPALQKRVIPTFHYALNSSGFLMLGTSETVGSFANLFGVVDPKSRIYFKKATGLRQYRHFHGRDVLTGEPADVDLVPLSTGLGDWQHAADSVVLKEYAPAGVLVNDDLDILQFRGQTGDYLAPPPGEPSHNLLKMAREGLLLELRSALNECRQGNAPVRRAGVQIRGQGVTHEIDLRVLPVKLPGSSEHCFLVLFEEPGHEPAAASGSSAEVTGPGRPARWLPRWLRRPFPRETAAAGGAGMPAPPDEREVARLQQELAAMREYLQSVIEQQDAVNEELKSANEEILSSNEELRSTNEEMETAKEELQSINEELVTVNEQLQNRNLELSRVSDDMTNLLGSANVPMVAVGVDLRIRWFTPAAGKLLSLLPADVGRQINDFKMVSDLHELDVLITEVIDSVQTEEREVRDRDGHWYLLRIRPYRTAEYKIDGAVVVLADIDEAKHAQLRLQESGAYAQSIVDTVRDPLLILTDDLRVKSANQSFYQIFRVEPEETEDRFVYDLGRGQWDVPPLRRLLEEVLPGDRAFEQFEIEHEFPGIGHRVMLLNARRMRPRDGAARLILLAFQDVTERRAEAALLESAERFHFLAESMPLVIFTAQSSGVVDFFNRHLIELTGLDTGSFENLDWMQFVHPGDLEETVRQWQHCIDTGAPFQIEHRFRPCATPQATCLCGPARAPTSTTGSAPKTPSRRPTPTRTNSWRCSPTNCATPWPHSTAACRCSPAPATRPTATGP